MSNCILGNVRPVNQVCNVDFVTVTFLCQSQLSTFFMFNLQLYYSRFSAIQCKSVSFAKTMFELWPCRRSVSKKKKRNNGPSETSND